LRAQAARRVGGLVHAYLLGLAAVAAAFQFVGEDVWWIGLSLYLPRALFALPLLLLLPVAWRVRATALVWCELSLALLLWLASAGLALPIGRARSSGPRLRVMTYNADECSEGFDALVARVRRHRPDVALLQEVCSNAQYVVEKLQHFFPSVRLDGEFLFASRTAPREFALGEHFARYELATELGTVVFYSIHPTSPRPALRAIWQLPWLDPGGLLRGGAAALAREDFARRERELTLAVHRAAREQRPVVLAGDTNLPTLSAYARRHLRGYEDAFRQAGSGFGYTFPASLPWLRLDRILASRELAFAQVEVANDAGGDHRPLVAALVRAGTR
jgi:vancomycin resistance protein VanJ